MYTVNVFVKCINAHVFVNENIEFFTNIQKYKYTSTKIETHF